MAVICLLSAKGSPGVTTTAVALTLAWSAATGRRAIAIDADPVGGDIAPGVLRGAIPAAAGMLSLATSRGAPPVVAVDRASVTLRPDGAARVIPGVPDVARAAALTLAWDVLAAARVDLDAAGTDLLVDAGRLDLSVPKAPWLTGCDRAVLLVRPSLPAVTAAHRLALGWTSAGLSASSTPLEVMVVDAASPYGSREIADVIGLPLLGTLAFDPSAASVHSEGSAPARGYDRSSYARGLHRIASELAERTGLERATPAHATPAPIEQRWDRDDRAGQREQARRRTRRGALGRSVVRPPQPGSAGDGSLGEPRWSTRRGGRT